MKSTTKADDVKLSFVKTFSKYSLIINSIFNKAKPYEKKFDKDLSAFNIEEILEFLKSYNAGTLNNLRSRISHINNYCYECKVQKVNGADEGEWDKLSIDMINSCLNGNKTKGRYIEPARMEKLITNLVNPVDRFLVRGIYEGLKGEYFEDIWDLYPQDVDRETRTLDLSHKKLAKYGLTTSRKLQVSQKLIDDMYASLEAEKYIYLRENGEVLRSLSLPECNGRFFKVGITRRASVDVGDINVEKQRIYTKLRLLQRATGENDFSIPVIITSAVVANIKAIAKKEKISEREAVGSNAFEEVKLRYDLLGRTKGQLLETYGYYLED